MNGPTLFDQPEEPTPYVAGSDTSRERAQREDADGTATRRRQLIMSRLFNAPFGMTWREMAKETGLHHGQVSGALSVLHKQGRIAMLKDKRDKCHPYVHPKYFDDYQGLLILEPAQTLAGRRQQAINEVLQAARAFCQTGLNAHAIREALQILDSLDN